MTILDADHDTLSGECTLTYVGSAHSRVITCELTPEQNRGRGRGRENADGDALLVQRHHYSTDLSRHVSSPALPTMASGTAAHLGII